MEEAIKSLLVNNVQHDELVVSILSLWKRPLKAGSSIDVTKGVMCFNPIIVEEVIKSWLQPRH